MVVAWSLIAVVVLALVVLAVLAGVLAAALRRTAAVRGAATEDITARVSVLSARATALGERFAARRG